MHKASYKRVIERTDFLIAWRVVTSSTRSHAAKLLIDHEDLKYIRLLSLAYVDLRHINSPLSFNKLVSTY